MQHTPGPWHFVPSSDARIPDRITNAAGSTIVSGSISFDPDARLIAAAPALLMHLQRLVAAIDRAPPNFADGLADEARAAIAAAQGEA